MRWMRFLDASLSRVRPVCMAAFTTVLGMLPLLWDAFFGSYGRDHYGRLDLCHDSDASGDTRYVLHLLQRKENGMSTMKRMNHYAGAVACAVLVGVSGGCVSPVTNG